MPLMLNDVNLAGNLTRDPELRAVGEKTVANFGLAINRRFKDANGEPKEEVTFVDVECWGRQAELCGQYIGKGCNVLIEGALKLSQWVDKEGKNCNKLSVNGRKVHFITFKDRDGEQGQEGQQRTVTTNRSSYSQPVAPSQPIDDEPPF